MLSTLMVSAHDIEVKNADGVTIYYNYINEGTELEVTYQGSSSGSYSDEYQGNVVIPEEVTYMNRTRKVTSIGSYAFDRCSGLTSVTIPNSVTSIGINAFRDCYSLTSVTIPNSVTSIGEWAFFCCYGLTSVTSEIIVPFAFGADAFSNISASCILTIPYRTEDAYNANGWTTNVFKGGIVETKSKVEGIYYGFNSYTKQATVIAGENKYSGNMIIPSTVNYAGVTYSVTEIEDFAFSWGTSLTSIIIPNSVKNIGSGAFAGCSSLTSVISKIIEPFSTDAFYKMSSNCALTIPYGTKDAYIAKGWTTDVFRGGIKEVTEIDGNYYNINSNTKQATVIAGENKYSGNVLIPNTVTYNEVTYSVTSIGEKAFSGCSGLTSVTIPNSVTSIGNEAFSGCPNLTKVELNSNTIVSKDYSISSNIKDIFGTQVREYILGKDVTSIGKYAFYRTYIGTLIVGAGVLRFGSNSFSTPIKTIWLTNTPPQNYTVANGFVNYVANSQYTDLYNNIVEYKFLSSMFEVDGLKYVPVSPSDRICDVIDCTYNESRSEININSTVTYRGVSMKVQNVQPYAFSGCSYLEMIGLGDGIESIGWSAFSSCSKLKSVTIPGSVNSIGGYAFQGCEGLKNVIMAERETDEVLSLGSYLFDNCSLDSVYIGRNISYDKSSSYGYSPFYRNTSLRTIVITDKEEEISDNEFYGCTNLQNVQIGDGVTSIGNWAFSGCSRLKNFSFGTQLKAIGTEAFSDCTGVTAIASKAQTPPVCSSQALDDINKWDCVLYVPEGYASSYQNADQWKEFFFIEEKKFDLRGDANGDGKVDMDDATFVTNIILGTEEATEAADVNNDGTVNMPDVMFIINYIKNGKFPDE